MQSKLSLTSLGRLNLISLLLLKLRGEFAHLEWYGMLSHIACFGSNGSTKPRSNNSVSLKLQRECCKLFATWIVYPPNASRYQTIRPRALDVKRYIWRRGKTKHMQHISYKESQWSYREQAHQRDKEGSLFCNISN